MRFLLVLAFLATPITASAQDFLLGRSYVDRTVTLGKRVFRIDLGPPEYGVNDSGFVNGPLGSPYGFRFGRDRVHTPGDTNVSSLSMIGLGVGFGVTSRVEVGANFLPFVLDASVPGLPGTGDDGDGIGNLTGYVRFALIDQARGQLGLQVAVSLPIASEFGLAVGLPVNMNLARGLRVETGAELETFFGDDIDGDDDEAWLVLDIPLALTKQIARRGFLGGRTGLTFIDLTGDGEIAVPVGAQGGMTFDGRHVAADLKASFQWFFFSDDTPNYRLAEWQLSFGMNMYVR